MVDAKALGAVNFWMSKRRVDRPRRASEDAGVDPAKIDAGGSAVKRSPAAAPHRARSPGQGEADARPKKSCACCSAVASAVAAAHRCPTAGGGGGARVSPQKRAQQAEPCPSPLPARHHLNHQYHNGAVPVGPSRPAGQRVATFATVQPGHPGQPGQRGPFPLVSRQVIADPAARHPQGQAFGLAPAAGDEPAPAPFPSIHQASFLSDHTMKLNGKLLEQHKLLVGGGGGRSSLLRRPSQDTPFSSGAELSSEDLSVQINSLLGELHRSQEYKKTNPTLPLAARSDSASHDAAKKKKRLAARTRSAKTRQTNKASAADPAPAAKAAAPPAQGQHGAGPASCGAQKPGAGGLASALKKCSRGDGEDGASADGDMDRRSPAAVGGSGPLKLFALGEADATARLREERLAAAKKKREGLHDQIAHSLAQSETELDQRIQAAVEAKRTRITMQRNTKFGALQQFWLTLVLGGAPFGLFLTKVASKVVQMKSTMVEQSIAIAKLKRHLIPLIQRHRARIAQARAHLRKFLFMWRMRRARGRYLRATSLICAFLRELRRFHSIKTRVSIFTEKVHCAQRAVRKLITRRTAQRELLLLQYHACEADVLARVAAPPPPAAKAAAARKPPAGAANPVQLFRATLVGELRTLRQEVRKLTAAKGFGERQAGETEACGGTWVGKPPSRDRALEVLARAHAHAWEDYKLRSLAEQLAMLPKRSFTPQHVFARLLREALRQRQRAFAAQMERWAAQQRLVQKQRHVAEAQRLLGGKTTSIMSLLKLPPKPRMPLLLQKAEMTKLVISTRKQLNLAVPCDIAYR
ncbi:hypothetical protein DIPPA_15222 [Diplonema papillatum]|nr:hypothetical protein DIPPA_15222 [Diplonema papillatum]